MANNDQPQVTTSNHEKRKQRILSDRKAQTQLFSEELASPRQEPAMDRHEIRKVNARAIREAIAKAKRFPHQILLAEYRPPRSVRHFCAGGIGLTLCGGYCRVENENRTPRTYAQIMQKTGVDCRSCRWALGLPELVIPVDTRG